MLKKIGNHTDLLKMNLQFFSDEYDDFILPDEGEPTAPEVDTEQNEPVEETTPPEVEGTTEDITETNEPVEETPKIRVKFNKEEKEIPLDEAVPLVQKGMNYDKLQEKLQSLESDPRLSFVEELAKEQGMEVQEYLEAVKQHKEQQRLNELVQQNIPEDMAKEILENRKFREQIEAERKQNSEEQKQNEEFNEFFSFFKEVNGRDYDANNDQLPDEVWQAHAQGVPLKYAYLEHHNQQMATQLKALKQNEENTKKAPVQGVTKHGGQEIASDDDFLKGFNSI